MSETKAVTKKDNGGVPAAMLKQMQADEGLGLDAIGQEDLTIPLIKLVQKTSPEVDPEDPKFIEGAVFGDMINSVTKKLWKASDGMRVIPCAYQRVFNEYKAEGGYLGPRDTNDPEMQDLKRVGNKDYMKNGNEVQLTAQFYCLVEDTDSGIWSQAILGMKSTSLKVSRNWNARIVDSRVNSGKAVMRLPYFGGIWRLSSSIERREIEENGKKTKASWAIYSVGDRESLTIVESEELYEQAKAFHMLVKDGLVKAAPDEELQESQDQESSSEASPF